MNLGPMDADMRGHNVAGITIAIEVRLFNSLFRFGGAPAGPVSLRLPAGSTVGDVLLGLGIPRPEVQLAFVNGRDVTPNLRGALNTERPLEDGDVVALSGPVPYSWGYGSPVV